MTPAHEALAAKHVVPVTSLAVGAGWLPLLDEYLKQVRLLEELTRLRLTHLVTKEKFGLLRVHAEYAMPEDLSEADGNVMRQTLHCIETYCENQSQWTCEDTGKAGSLFVSPSGWFRTLSEDRRRELGFITVGEWREKG